MWKNRDVFVFVFFVSLGKSDRCQNPIPEPLNVTLLWTDEFHANFSWTAPESMEGCDCEYKVLGWDAGNVTTKKLSIHGLKPLENGLTLSVQTYCNGSHSKPVVQTYFYPEMVKNFKCFLYTQKSMNCSWIPANDIEDLQLFYWHHDSRLKVCSHYLYRNHTKTGCHLTEINCTDDFYFLVNGTLRGLSIMNTFRRIPLKNVEAQPLNVYLTTEGGDLIIRWTPPRIHKPHCWNYTINYTVCDDPKLLVSLTEITSFKVHFFPHCQYRIAVKAVLQKYCGKGESPWKEIIYGKNYNPHVSVYVATVVITVVVATAAVLAFVCWRRVKHKILPKVPEPAVILRDVFNNLNDPIIVRSLYVPPQEDDNHNVTLMQQPDS